MIDGYLIHCYVHYRTMTSVTMVLCLKIWLSNLRSVTIYSSDNTTTILFLHFFSRLENWRKQTLILHERAIMMSCLSYTTGYTTRNIIFKITIKSLVFTVFNFKISKIATTMLGSQRSFLHINICIILLFLFRVSVVATGIATVLIIE